MKKRLLLLLIFSAHAASVSADEAMDQAIAAFHRDAQLCKTTQDQQIVSELVKVPGKPLSEPATAEESAEVKAIMAQSGVPENSANYKVSYQVALGLIRVRNMAVFKVSSSSSADDLSAVKDCLGRLATESGVEFRFE